MVAILIAVSCAPADPPPTASPPVEVAAVNTGPPNVIWILMDTLRAENLSAYGYERPTSPNIDALGARGVLFENHFSQGLWTMISVPTLLTGRYFPVNIVENFDYRVINRYPPIRQRSAPQIFKQNGYKTAMFTAHRLLVSESSRLGKAFDEAFPILNASGQKPHGTFADVIDQFSTWHNPEEGKPFFAYFHLMDNHFPHMPVGKYAQWLRDDYTPEVFGPAGPIDTDQNFSEADIQHMAGLYDGDILFVDDQLERLQAYLKRQGILDNTIIVITSDHGDLLGEDGRSWGHDGFSHDQIMHVPWIMAGPGIPKGVRVNNLTENVDVLPTLIEVLGLSTDADFDGKSLTTSFEAASAADPREYIFTREPSKRHYDYPTSFILRTNAFKYKWDSDTGEEHLWKVPDNIGDRVDVLDANREVAAALKQEIEQKFKPRFDAYMATEIQWILGRIGGGQSQNWHPESAVRVLERDETADNLGTDNLWASIPTMAGPNFLTSCGWSEDAPPVTLTYPVPDGRYHVSVELGRHILLNDRASSLAIRAEGDSAYAPVRFESGEEPWHYVYGGTWNIQDGSFDIGLDEGGKEDWASIRRLRMHPAPNATFSFPIDALFEQRRGGTALSIGPPDAFFIQAEDLEDTGEAAANRWRVVRSSAAPYATLLPPFEPDTGAVLKLSVHVPNLRYGIDLELDSAIGQPERIRFRANDDEAFRAFQPPNPASNFLSAGAWQVENGVFELALEALPGEQAFAIYGLHLVPVAEDGQPISPTLLTHRSQHPADPEQEDAAVEVDRAELETIGYVH